MHLQLAELITTLTTTIGPCRNNGTKDGDFEHAVMAQLGAAGIEYEYQPNGSQNAPDFNVTINGMTIGVECKTTKTGGIMWNSNHANPDYVYVYQNTATGKTVCFVGDQLISGDEIKLLTAYVNESKALADRYNKELKKIGSAWRVYPRKMFINTTNIIRKFIA